MLKYFVYIFDHGYGHFITNWLVEVYIQVGMNFPLLTVSFGPYIPPSHVTKHVLTNTFLWGHFRSPTCQTTVCWLPPMIYLPCNGWMGWFHIYVAQNCLKGWGRSPTRILAAHGALCSCLRITLVLLSCHSHVRAVSFGVNWHHCLYQRSP